MSYPTRKNDRGYILIEVIVFTTIATMLMAALANWAALNYRSAQTIVLREKAFQFAESGIEYYRWHLAHAPHDFFDGHGASSTGPYIHNYYDKYDNNIGSFELTITPPSTGSTVVKIVSKGKVVENPSISRSIEVKMAVPSIAKYAFVANSVMRYGQGTEVFGPIHSNDGIRFDGIAHNVVTSAKQSYLDPDHNGVPEFGVHTHVQAPPGNGVPEGGINSEQASNNVLPVRTDVFMSGRQVGVPAVDFNGFTQNLSDLKTLANNGGMYLGPSGAVGYNIVLKTNGTYDVYKVNSQDSVPKSCSKQNADYQDGWDSWTVNKQTLFGSYTYPANGIIFVEDNVWVEGKINNNHLTIAAGRFPESAGSYANISFTKDILYTNYDGRDALGLIAQGNVIAGLESEDNLEIDAALVAKNGRVGRYYYNGSCHPWDVLTKIRIYGMIASYIRYGFSYIESNGNQNGYGIREIVYDGNLLYGPPPSFPLTTDQYQTISWREI